jgi:hypothetical protein
MLDRLIRRIPPGQLQWGTVKLVEKGNKRVQIVGRNGIESWAHYLPDDFPGLDVGHSVAVGDSDGSLFLVRQEAIIKPQSTTILLV